MPPHTYTLLSDLKIITTGVLSYLMLNRQLNKRAAASLVLLFTGICLGQYGTSTDSSSTAASSTAAAGPLGWVHGVLVMSLVAVLSAVAAVYTEWVMNFSATYKHESINLQVSESLVFQGSDPAAPLPAYIVSVSYLCTG
jgi:hypothetical protein